MANDSLDYLSKKRRVGGLPSTPSAITLTTPTKGQTTISNITLRKWNSHAGPPGSSSSPAPGAIGGGNHANQNSPVTKLQPPKYCPGDRDQLVRRLATFQELTDWTPKPDRVNEIEWAKRGWVCQGKERVKCTLCNNELAVKLNRKEVDGKEIPVLIAADIAESVVDQYAELIITSHREDCLWRKKGCDGECLPQGRVMMCVLTGSVTRFASTITSAQPQTSPRNSSPTIRRALPTQGFSPLRVQPPPAGRSRHRHHPFLPATKLLYRAFTIERHNLTIG